MRYTIIAILICIAPLATQAQQWTLQNCIETASERNIEVQRGALDITQSEIELSTSKNSRLPNLNASLSGDASFGRVLTSENIYRNRNQNSASVGVNANMSLFEGFRINNQIKADKLSLQASIEDLNALRENISIEITTLYLQVLFNKELLSIAEQQLELSELQATRSRSLVEAGKEPKSAIYESEALVANDRLSVTDAQNTLQISLLDLSQAMNLESQDSFDIVVPATDSATLAQLIDTSSPSAIYNFALEHRPQIKAEELRTETSQHNIAIARSSLYPSLSLGGGYNSGFYSADDADLWQQMSNNSREYVGLSLNIPIFNRKASRNSIKSAQIASSNAALSLLNAKQRLRKDIETAWSYATTAYRKYESATVALKSARIAFQYEEQRAAAGRSTIFEFSDAKTRMQSAESELTRAKFEFLLRSKILDFYQGEPLRL